MANVTPFPATPERPRQRAKKKSIEKGILPTPHGYLVTVRVLGELKAQRFPPEAKLTVMRDWRMTARVTGLAAAAQRTGKAVKPGTLADDVRDYLKGIATMPRLDQRTKHMTEWLEALGPERTRDSIQTHEIQAELHRLRKSGCPVIEYVRDANNRAIRKVVGHRPYSESEVNKRRTALMHFFRVMNGKSGRNPVRDIPKFREPDPEPRGVPMDTIERILAHLKPSVTKARLSVMAYTGIPHLTLALVRPEDVRWDVPAVYLHGRRKGKGTKGRMLPLRPEAVKAFRLMETWDAWGQSRADGGHPKRGWSSLNPAVGRACRALKIPVIRSYDFRHSFGTAVYAASGDLHATGKLLGHSDSRLTARYALGAEDPRQIAALNALGALLPSNGKRAGHRKSRGKKTRR